jgi:glycine cleavage system regulatory protein
MTSTLVATVMSDDRPGLVEALSEAVVENGGNWLESRMSRLAGKFAGILLVSVPDNKALVLTLGLQALEAQGFKITLERSAGGAAAGDYRSLVLDLIGQDHPGIVHDISHVLGRLGIRVENLLTECVSGSMSGEKLFKATVQLRVPSHVAIPELRDVLEGLANELMVDINLEEPPAA